MGVIVGVRLGVGVMEGVGVRLAVGVTLAVWVALGVAVGLGLAVGLRLGVAVGVADGRGVTLGCGAAVGVSLGGARRAQAQPLPKPAANKPNAAGNRRSLRGTMPAIVAETAQRRKVRGHQMGESALPFVRLKQ